MGTFQVSFGFLHYIVFTSFQQGLSIDLNHVYSTMNYTLYLIIFNFTCQYLIFLLHFS